MTLAPAILRMLGKLVYWPFGIKQRDPNASEDLLPNATAGDKILEHNQPHDHGPTRSRASRECVAPVAAGLFDPRADRDAHRRGT